MVKKGLKKIFYRLKHVNIYMIHHVSTNGPFYSGCVLDTDKFYQFIDCKRHNIISLTQALEGSIIKNNKRNVITFDDGLYDLYTIVYPYLVERNIPFTVFICVDLLDTEGYISKEQLIEMSKNPLITVGSHGITHEILKGMDVAKQEIEIKKSKETLENLVGKDITIFAYSHGQYDENTIKLLKKYNYKYALSTIPRPYNFFTKLKKYLLPRWNVTNESYKKMIEKN